YLITHQRLARRFLNESLVDGTFLVFGGIALVSMLIRSQSRFCPSSCLVQGLSPLGLWGAGPLRQHIMLDIAFIREFPDLVKAGAEKKRIQVDVDRLLDVDRQRRGVMTEIEQWRAERNRKSKTVSSLPPSEREALLAETRGLTEQLRHSEAALAPLQAEFEHLMLKVPNL